MNTQTEQTAPLNFRILPTLTSSILKMDNAYDPRMTVGILQGDKDLNGLVNYNFENRVRVLNSMDQLLANQISGLTLEQVAFHFNTLAHKIEANMQEINLLNNKYSSHRAKQTAKLKSKPMPMPTPSSSGLSKKAMEEQENVKKHELAQKKSFQKTPFKIRTPFGD